MKIGVDARLLSRPLTGIGRYTFEMCKALSKIENISLFLYSPAPILDNIKSDLGSTQIKTANWQNGLLRQIWSETYLPLWATEDRVDIFWGPTHRLPRFLPKNIARIVTIHDLVWKYAGNTMPPLSCLLEKYQMPFAVQSADIIIVDSQSTYEGLTKEFNIDNNRVEVITPAANYIQNNMPFAELKKYNISQPFFLFVGTIEPRKNLTRLLKAYSSLPEALKSQIMLVIAGGKGWGKTDLRDNINKLGLKENVNILGYVEDTILRALYAHAQFLAMPSVYEGFGLPLLEAMVQGTPVLTADNSSMPEVAGDAGLLVDATNVSSIKEGLFQIISDDILRNKLAQNAKIQAGKFSWNKSARQMAELFEKMVLERNSS